MHIHNIQSRVEGNEKVISGCLDDFELWFRLPVKYGSCNQADPFVAAALLIAMSRGEEIRVADQWPVSFKLMQGISELRGLYCSWYPNLQDIDIHARLEPVRPWQTGFAAFFSGGVDSLFTFYRKQQELTHLVFIGGIDIQLDNISLQHEVLEKNTAFCQGYGKELIPVKTNLRDLCIPAGLSWGKMYSGAGLAAVALLLGFPFMMVPASQSWGSQFVEGTSPALDHLFSNEATSIYYDGAFPRPVKMKLLGQHPDALALLRVCWQDKGYNCGKCEKCLRTMLIFRILDIDCPTLPPLDDLSKLKGWRIESSTEVAIFGNILKAARNSRHPEIYRYLSRIQQREQLRRWSVAVDRKLTGGRLKLLARTLSGQTDINRKQS